MTTEIRVPTLGESVVEATVGQWFKQAGEAVAADEPLVELETDKVTVEVPAPAGGVLSEIVVKEGDTVEVGALLGSIAAGDGAAVAPAPKVETKSADSAPKPAESAPAPQPAPAPASDAPALKREPYTRTEIAPTSMPPSPAAQKLLAEKGLSADELTGTGRRGQILKGDVIAATAAAETLRETPRAPKPPAPPRAPVTQDDEAREERVRMTRLRQTIAKRLKDAQDTAAMLTTFNDVDMSQIMTLRKEYKDDFQKRHGVKLGFMGFFVKACVQALKDIPAVNAEIDGNDLVYKNYYHVGVAVGTERGLVVPVIRDADRMSLAEIESTIADFGVRAREGKLGLAEMQGGTFTISNGGIYGSMLSTPILNAPQSGILGMHRIEERPVVRDGQIVARPMMYLALSYDHRIVDGKEAVTFLVNVKDSLENPARLILDL
ncbi:2-oxoglutarate dehydrogenase complex dihydrolipoyllysine-residue succinyltransferase [Methyloceanibacter caenitepidi]|uniref:Dihydrolipoyllysine-residue succinyltransferase component of 2-oxoglutarate dehydrogenase complex n=1 Tax=Methyloceanibacter caenitepidi TaxID=1384459 RepID=A0A0A8JYA9_9HYPH|nr:2-oxoglutarate dehydrogenase complex dihydrolipoyllysine-residue succinyltransferase [Methyloceanibacter caenitepidi]BAQ15580.1 dihydrolipoamide succinyltransferase component (E2) of 2-oxoglutarate dehydrogenase complex [Methyloceanibacter caenitepidi]